MVGKCRSYRNMDISLLVLHMEGGKFEPSFEPEQPMFKVAEAFGENEAVVRHLIEKG